VPYCAVALRPLFPACAARLPRLGWDGQMTGMRTAVKSARHALGELLYERRYRVRTSGKLVLDAHDAESIYYIAMNWRQLRRVLPPGSVTDRDVFLDIGSGMGRAVLQAAAGYPFARVIGVELCRELHEVAQRNITETTRKLRCRNIELVCADARDYRIPDDVTVIFMNNSVRGSIFAAVLDQISASMCRRYRPVRLIYGNPLEDEAVLATDRWRKVRTVTTGRSRFPYGATSVYESSAGQ
jgi:SAM-dependent methyltransferase